jgi:glutathione S-transferase
MATVYHAPNTRSMRVLWLLEELGVKAEIKSLPFPPSKLQPDYLSVNPTGTVPTLVDGSVRLTESMAICEYLATRYNSPLIVGPDHATPSSRMRATMRASGSPPWSAASKAGTSWSPSG